MAGQLPIASLSQMTPAGLVQREADEGLRTKAYPDPLSPLTVACKTDRIAPEDYRLLPSWPGLSGAPWTDGYGNTQGVHEDDVVSPEDAKATLLRNVANTEVSLCAHLPFFAALDPVRQDCLTNIAFNVGVVGLLHCPPPSAKSPPANTLPPPTTCSTKDGGTRK